jgi:uncharacterized peroxidase-related enzyme
MSRISIPASIEAAPTAAQALLDAPKKSIGSVPNLLRLIASSPTSIEGFLGLFEALDNGQLPAPTHESMALAVAQVNGCEYCLSAHTFFGRNIARLDDTEITANRNGASNDLKMDAAVRFAAPVTCERGHVSEGALQDVRRAGDSDPEIIEIVMHVALNALTNYVNEVAGTDVDFPVIHARQAA